MEPSFSAHLLSFWKLHTQGPAPATGPPHEGLSFQVTWDFRDLQPRDC